MKLKSFIIFFLIILYSLALSNCSSNKIASKNYLSGSIPVPESTLLAEVIMHLQIDYVYPEKLNPNELLQGALIELGRTIPEVWVLPIFDKNDILIAINSLSCKQIVMVNDINFATKFNTNYFWDLLYI